MTTQPRSPESFMTATQVAALVNLDPKTVTTAALAGEFGDGYFTFGGQGRGKRYRFDPEAVRRWIESKRAAA